MRLLWKEEIVELEVNKFFKGYVLEVETNSTKARSGIYFSTSINYKREMHLKGTDSNMVIISILAKAKIQD